MATLQNLYNNIKTLITKYFEEKTIEDETLPQWVELCFNYNQDKLNIGIPHMELTVTGSSFSTYTSTPFTYNGKVFVDWGDNSEVVEYAGGKLTHSFTDGLNSHTVKVYGDITSLEYNCFYNCTGLTNIELSESIISLGNSVFSNCTGLTSISIPSSVTSLGQFCFEKCSNLTSVELHDNLTIIDFACFWACYSLTSISIPSSVTSLGQNCFMSCTGLTSIQLNWTLTDILTYDSNWIINANSSVKFSIPNDTTSLYTAKGYPSDKLVESDLNTGIHHMELTVTGSSFDTTYSSTPFPYSGRIFVDWGDNSGFVEYTGGKLTHSFTDGLNSHTVKVYGNITNLGDSCFDRCTGLTSITLPDGVTSMGHHCFNGCTGLTSITLPDSITSFGNFCFNGCTGLTSITLPDSVTSLGLRCFMSCTGLTSITIPESVTSLGNYCFEGCTGLTNINLNWDTSNRILTYNTNWLYNLTNVRFSVPSGTSSLYTAKEYPSNLLQESD